MAKRRFEFGLRPEQPLKPPQWVCLECLANTPTGRNFCSVRCEQINEEKREPYDRDTIIKMDSDRHRSSTDSNTTVRADVSRSTA